MALKTLSKQVKRFIVESLACFDTPTEVEKAVKEEFKLDVTRQIVFAYDASRAYNRKKMSDELVELFDETREAFKKSSEGIPIANKQYRLRLLQKAAERAMSKGNTVLAMQAAEQAAKETGEFYTNRRLLEHMGPNGGPIQGIVGVVELTDGEAAQEVARLLNAARDRAAAAGDPIAQTPEL